jgi:hypothetical protein
MKNMMKNTVWKERKYNCIIWKNVAAMIAGNMA